MVQRERERERERDKGREGGGCAGMSSFTPQLFIAASLLPPNVDTRASQACRSSRPIVHLPLLFWRHFNNRFDLRDLRFYRSAPTLVGYKLCVWRAGESFKSGS